MALGEAAWSALRLALSRALREGSAQQAALQGCLVPQAEAEYEVARLHPDPALVAQVDAMFKHGYTVKYNLAPPTISKRDPVTGHLIKQQFGPWMRSAFGWLKKFKGLRGGGLDIFGKTEERRHERQMIDEYIKELDGICAALSPVNHDAAVALASLTVLQFKPRRTGEVRLFRKVAARRASAAPSQPASPRILAIPLPVVTPYFGCRTAWHQFFSLLRLHIKGILGHPAFLVMLLIALANFITNYLVGGLRFDSRPYPLTRLMLSELEDGMNMVLSLVMMIFAGPVGVDHAARLAHHVPHHRFVPVAIARVAGQHDGAHLPERRGRARDEVRGLHVVARHAHQRQRPLGQPGPAGARVHAPLQREAAAPGGTGAVQLRERELHEGPVGGRGLHRLLRPAILHCWSRRLHQR